MHLQNKDKQLMQYTLANLLVIENIAHFFIQNDITAYRDPIGGHLRHIIEHYETLIFRKSDSINYDSRVRDALLEDSPIEAVNRIKAINQKLQESTIFEIDEILKVSSVGGAFGEYLFTNVSSVGREICFLNSHCIHHFAIIKPICIKLGVPIDEYFGYAPSTIAHLTSQKLEAL